MLNFLYFISLNDIAGFLILCTINHDQNKEVLLCICYERHRGIRKPNAGLSGFTAESEGADRQF